MPLSAQPEATPSANADDPAGAGPGQLRDQLAGLACAGGAMPDGALAPALSPNVFAFLLRRLGADPRP